MLFESREQAGAQLADALQELRREDGVVCAVACGGVPIGGIIARLLGWPLDVVWVRRILHPASEEYAIGAVGENGELILDEKEAAEVDVDWLAQRSVQARLEIRHWKALSVRFCPREVAGKFVLVVDDGIVTGFSLRAALQSVHDLNASRVIASVPVAPLAVASALASQADELIILHAVPYLFTSLDACYGSFDRITEDETISYLETFAAGR